MNENKCEASELPRLPQRRSSDNQHSTPNRAGLTGPCLSMLRTLESGFYYISALFICDNVNVWLQKPWKIDFSASCSMRNVIAFNQLWLNVKVSPSALFDSSPLFVFRVEDGGPSQLLECVPINDLAVSIKTSCDICDAWPSAGQWSATRCWSGPCHTCPLLMSAASSTESASWFRPWTEWWENTQKQQQNLITREESCRNFGGVNINTPAICSTF